MYVRYVATCCVEKIQYNLLSAQVNLIAIYHVHIYTNRNYTVKFVLYFSQLRFKIRNMAFL